MNPAGTFTQVYKTRRTAEARMAREQAWADRVGCTLAVVPVEGGFVVTMKDADDEGDFDGPRLFSRPDYVPDATVWR